MTMSLVQTVTVGSGGAASIEFTSIPQDATDLLVLISGRSTATDNNFDTLDIKLNSSTSFNYSVKILAGTGSAASSEEISTTGGLYRARISAANNTANTFGSTSVYLSNYTSAVAKSLSIDTVSENNATEAHARLLAASWAGTAAVTGVSFALLSGNFVQHSTASLYKITKGSDGIVTVS